MVERVEIYDTCALIDSWIGFAAAAAVSVFEKAR